MSECWWIGKDLVGSGCGLILRCDPVISLDGLRKTTKNSIRIAGRQSWNLNPGPPEYDAVFYTLNHDVRWENVANDIFIDTGTRDVFLFYE
jgi:hypothetical protein